MQSSHWLSDLGKDLQLVLRGFLRKPAFGIMCILLVALGVGATSGVFALFYTVLMRAMAVQNPEELVEIGCVDPTQGEHSPCRTSYPGFEIYRDDNAVFSGVFAFTDPVDANAVYDGTAEIVSAALASGEIFDVLGISPVAGRLFSRSDDRNGSPPVAVISYGYWQRKLGGSHEVIGKTLTLNNHPLAIVGVTPRTFRGMTLGSAPDVTVPLSNATLFLNPNILGNHSTWWLRIVGRRKIGVTIEQAQASLEPLFQRTIEDMRRSLPAGLAAHLETGWKQLRLKILPAGTGVQSSFRQNLEKPLKTLMAAVWLVLVIVCANVACLLLIRAYERRREFGLRTALGASHERLFRQALTENLFLALIGGFGGMGVSKLVSSGLLWVVNRQYGSSALNVTLNGPVFLFALAASIFTGLVFGTGPALRASGANPDSLIREVGGGRTRARWMHGLVGIQIAFTMILLTGAGLFLQSFRNWTHLNLGFRYDNLILLKVRPGLAGYTVARTHEYMKEVCQRIEAEPGIRSVTWSSYGMGELSNETPVEVSGFVRDDISNTRVGHNAVGPRFVETLGLRLTAGRDIQESDSVSLPGAAIVNESFARHFYGSLNVIGKSFKFVGETGQPNTIVGVVADAYDRGPKNPDERVAYTLFDQDDSLTATVAARTNIGADAAIAESKQAVQSLDPTVPIYEIRTMQMQLDNALGREHAMALLATAFAAIALFLATIGIYGLLTHTAGGRTKEMAVRMAVGAQPADVLRLIFSETSWLLLWGIVGGLVGAFALTRIVMSQLFGVHSISIIAFTIPIVILTCAGFIAAFVPALRACRAQPVIALRHE